MSHCLHLTQTQWPPVNKYNRANIAHSFRAKIHCIPCIYYNHISKRQVIPETISSNFFAVLLNNMLMYVLYSLLVCIYALVQTLHLSHSSVACTMCTFCTHIHTYTLAHSSSHLHSHTRTLTWPHLHTRTANTRCRPQFYLDTALMLFWRMRNSSVSAPAVQWIVSPSRCRRRARTQSRVLAAERQIREMIRRWARLG